MKKLVILFALFAFQSILAKGVHSPDTVVVGIYINSIHDIDFREKEYTLNLWLWLKYKNPDFDFSKYLEVPMAKSIDKSFYTVDTLTDGRIYMLMKLQCVMKDNWKFRNFPFDYQKLRFSIENSQYDSGDLVFKEDTFGKHFSKWLISGWEVMTDSFKISTGKKKYETAFGDPTAVNSSSEFSNYKMQIGIERDCWWLFLKLFIGMYISFLLSLLSFFIHYDSIESRFSLLVGSLFAVIGNKYVIDSSLPESTTFTLVDSLHGLTLFYIFVAAACSVYSLSLIKSDKIQQMQKFNKLAAWGLFAVYVLLNIWMVSRSFYA